MANGAQESTGKWGGRASEPMVREAGRERAICNLALVAQPQVEVSQEEGRALSRVHRHRNVFESRHLLIFRIPLKLCSIHSLAGVSMWAIYPM